MVAQIPFRLTGRISGLLARVRPRDQLTINLGWYGVAEVISRLSRLVATVVLARMLGATELGIAAIAITCFELIRVIANNGIGPMIVRAREDELAATCATAYRLGWVVCILVALIQIAAGAVIAHYCQRPELFWMIGATAGVYLTMPHGMIQCHLVVRANRLTTIARIATVQVVVDNALTTVLAVAGFGAWAVVLPKLLTAPLWMLGIRRAQSWHRDPGAGRVAVLPMLRFGGAIVGSELLTALRLNADKLLVGGILGVEALGIYYFAFNAGIGFSLSLTTALSASLYPHLAETRSRPREMMARFRRALVRSVAPISGLIALQGALAFVYVPIVFGARWEAGVPLVAMLCASAVTKPLFDASAQLLRAAGMPARELIGSLLFSLAYLGVFAAALPWDWPAGSQRSRLQRLSSRSLLPCGPRDRSSGTFWERRRRALRPARLR